MVKTEHYNQESEKEIENLLLGRRIVDVVEESTEIEESCEIASGVMTLDDDTKIYVLPNFGCSCGAGYYTLTSLAKVDNVITSVRLESKSDDESDYDGDTSYRIYVVADAVKINAVQIDGNDGNGYYGTGYELIVKKNVMTPQFGRWPAKPRRGQRCDNTLGSEIDTLGGVALNRCPNIATETVKLKPGITDFSTFYLCKDCLVDLDKQGRILRNPKRKIK